MGVFLWVRYHCYSELVLSDPRPEAWGGHVGCRVQPRHSDRGGERGGGGGDGERESERPACASGLDATRGMSGRDEEREREREGEREREREKGGRERKTTIKGLCGA